MTSTTVETIETDVPKRLDRLPWSQWHWLVVSPSGSSGSSTASRSPSSGRSGRRRRLRLGERPQRHL